MNQPMKRATAFFGSALVAVATVLPATSVLAAGPNTIANPGFETASGSLPASWLQGKWGTNTAVFTYDTSGHSGSRAASVKVSGYSSGDAKWYATPVNVTAGATYTFSDWYKSGVATNLDAVVTTTTGATAYYYVASPAASTAWKQQVATFKAPADAKQITFFHSISKNGTLSVDDFSLTDNGGTVTPTPTPTPPTPTPPTPTPPTPTPAPTPPTVSVTAPTANATVSGKTQAVTANASDAKAVSSVQFKLDGANLGTADTTAPYSVVWDTTTATNAVHKLTAVASNSSNLAATSAEVSVTVSNVVIPPTPPTPTPPASGNNLVANPSVESATNNVPNSWANDSWGTNTRAFSYENTGQDGARSVKTTVSQYTDGDAKWYFNPVTVTTGTTYSYTEYYKSNVDTEVDAQVTLKDGTVQYVYLGAPAASPNAWTKLSYQYVAPANAANVTIFHVVAKVGYVQVDNISFGPLTTTPATQFSRPLVSLTFDDGWRSIYTNGLPALKKYGLVSTQYLNSEPVTGGYPDYMTYQMVKDYKAQGSELAWHTQTHADLATLTTAKIDTELTIPATFLTGINDAKATFQNFATPYGSYNAQAITEIKKFYGSHRSTDVGYNSKDNFDRYNIKVQNITNTTTPAEVQTWLNQAASTKTWLVIVYHEVDAAAEDPTYAVTPANLDAELNLVKQSGLTVKTVAGALSEITPQL